jgi:pimeloyl-ACP methyl ester carboxylesterase
MRAVDGPAGRIAWRSLGTGPPLLLINGYGATKDDWDPAFLDALATGSTVICPDNRGVGDSGRGQGELSIRAMADDSLAVLDVLGIDAAALAGWSMGGFIAQDIAARRRDRVESLILLSTDPGGGLAARRSDQVQRMLTDHGGTPREQATRLLQLLFPPGVAAGIDAEFGEIVAAARARLRPEVLRDQEDAMGRWYAEPADERLAAIAAPALVAAGSEDVVIPPLNAELLASHVDNSWLARFPGGGHAFMAQWPQRLGSLINAFLDRG